MLGILKPRLKISIHAPRTGSDRVQEILDAGGAISIHAPRTGSDRKPDPPDESWDDFNPRSPHGERQELPALRDAIWHFNPRSPHGERLLPGATVRRLPKISIHAPRTGSDDAQPACGGQRHDFNPRSPHGERQALGINMSVANLFQSTLPARGATTFPLAYPRRIRDFNPRSPHGERPFVFLIRRIRQRISIHAPRTGSDANIHNFCPFFSTFQSTLPARGATYRQLKTIYQQRDFNPRSPHGERPTPAIIAPAAEDISIHAPRTGSDVKDMQTCSTTLHFNPRSPHGERHLLHGVERLGAYFNPRSPHGERLSS